MAGSLTLLSTRRTGLVQGPAGVRGFIGPPGTVQQSGGFVGVLAPFQGGTGITSPGPIGNVLTSTGSGAWVSAPIPSQLPGGAEGDLLIWHAGAWTVLAPGTLGQVLTSTGPTTEPSYQTPATGGDMPSPLVINSPGSPALSTAQTWIEFTSGAAGIILPAAPVVGRRILLTHTAGLLEIGSGNPVSLSGNGHNVVDPQDLLATPTTPVSLHTSGVNYTFAFNGTVFRCVGIG